MKKIVLISALLILGYSIFAQRTETKQGNWSFTGYVEGQDSTQTPIAKMDIIKANVGDIILVYDTTVIGDRSPATRQLFNVDGAIQIGTTATPTPGSIWYDSPYFFGQTGSGKDTLNGGGSGAGGSYDGQLIDSSYVDYYSGANDAAKITAAWTAVDHIKFSREYTLTASLSPPAGKTFEFLPGGKLTATTGTITGDNTTIINHDDHDILDERLTFAGTWRYSYITPLWFGADSTGISNSREAFWSCNAFLHDGAKFYLKSGTYLISSSYTYFDAYDNVEWDFGNSKLIGGGTGVGMAFSSDWKIDDSYTEDFISGLDSTDIVVVAGYEVEKHNNYIKIVDSTDWKAYAGFNNGVCKINIGINDNSGADTRYWKAVTFTFKEFGVEGGSQVIYSKLPFPRDVELGDALSIRNYDHGGGADTLANYIQIIPLFDGYRISNINSINMSFVLSNVVNATIQNCNIELADSLAEAIYLPQAFLFNLGDNVKILNYNAVNFQRAGFGYGINAQAVDNLLIDGFTIENCRHGISVSGGYNTMSQSAIVTNGTIIKANIDFHGNQFKPVVHGVTSYYSSLMSNRGNGGSVFNCVIHNGVSSGVLLTNTDPYDDDDVLIHDITMYNSSSSIVFCENIRNDNIVIYDCQSLNMKGVTTGTASVAYMKGGVQKDINIRNVTIDGEIDQEETIYGVFLDSTSCSNFVLDNLYAKNFNTVVHLSEPYIDTLTIKNSYAINFNTILRVTNNQVDTAYYYVKNNEFISFESATYMSSNTKDYILDYDGNKLNTFDQTWTSGITAGVVNKWMYRNNEIRNYNHVYSLIPLYCYDIEFNGNIIFPSDTVQATYYIANRGAELSGMVFADQLNIAGARTDAGAVMRITNNKFLSKIDNAANHIKMQAGTFIYTGNYIQPIDGLVGSYLKELANLDSCVIANNEWHINKAITRGVYCTNDLTTQGVYYFYNNTAINSATSANFINSHPTNFNGGSTVYVGSSQYKGFGDDTFGGANTIVLPIETRAENIHVNETIETKELTVGYGVAGIDYVVNFDGQSNDGTMTWMEDEIRLDFSDNIDVAATTSTLDLDVGNDINIAAGGIINFALANNLITYGSGALRLYGSTKHEWFVAGTHELNMTATHIYPQLNRGISLGGSSNRFLELHTDNLADDGTNVTIGSDLIVNSSLINGLRSRTYTILKPNEAQTETDDVILMNVHEAAYPYGITIKNIRISTSASSTDTHELEIWADRIGTSQSTIESITCSGQETDVDNGDIDTPGVDAGEYINVNLDNATDDISSLEITITFTINES